MIISKSKKFVFIHIYKTAGTSISGQLLPYARPIEKLASLWKTRYIVSAVNRIFGIYGNGNKWINGVHKHASATEIRDYLGDSIYNEYLSFAFVRNPYDWLVSRYHYICDTINHEQHSEVTEQSFEEFVKKEIASGTKRQVDFLRDENKKLIVSYIGKYETLDKDICEIAGRLMIPIKKLERHNKSNRKMDFRGYYTKELLEAVNEYFIEDFLLFKYNLLR